MLHGWGATAQSLRLLAEGIAAAGYSVLVPTLPGHGTSATQMMGTGPLDWIAAARAALQLLSSHFKEVYILGVSMGGALTLQLASLEQSAVQGIITVNAPIFFDRPYVRSRADVRCSGGHAPRLGGAGVRRPGGSRDHLSRAKPKKRD